VFEDKMFKAKAKARHLGGQGHTNLYSSWPRGWGQSSRTHPCYSDVCLCAHQCVELLYSTELSDYLSSHPPDITKCRQQKHYWTISCVSWVLRTTAQVLRLHIKDAHSSQRLWVATSCVYCRMKTSSS